MYEAFAPTFAVYVHAQVLGPPCRVEVLHGGRPVHTYVSCVAADTCTRKSEALLAVLGW